MWDRLRSHLTRTDVIALSLPGFDAPIPDGFSSTKEDYAAWVIEELEAILVTHCHSDHSPLAAWLKDLTGVTLPQYPAKVNRVAPAGTATASRSAAATSRMPCDATSTSRTS